MKRLDWTRLLGFDQSRQDAGPGSRAGSKQGLAKTGVAAVGVKAGIKLGAKPV